MITALFLVATIAWAALLWHDHNKAVHIFAGLLPLYILRISVGPLPTTFLEVAFWMLVLVITYRDGLKPWQHGWKQFKPWLPACAAWCFATILAIFVAPNLKDALGLWRAYVLEPVLFFILFLGSTHTKDERHNTIHALAIATACLATAAIIQFLGNIGIPHPWDTVSILTRRATSIFPFPNALALFTAPVAVLCAALLVRPHPTFVLSKKILWLGLVSGIISVALAKSLGGLFAIFIPIAILLVATKKTRWPTLIVLALIIAGLATPIQVRKRVVSYLTFHQWSGQVRIIIWEETWHMLSDRPFFGAGFGAYPDVVRPYHAAKAIEIFQYPHNIILNIWSETGVLGLIAFALVCGTWIRLAWKANNLFLALPLLALLIHGIVDVPYFKNDLAMQFWILAGLGTSKLPPAKGD